MSTSSVILKNQPSIIETVPPEIWAEIFQNIQHGTGEKSTREERELTKRTILSVSQTCRLWRDVTIEVPYLWTTILVDFGASTPSNNLNMTNLWLEHSKDTPLSIALFNIPEADTNQLQSRECLIAVLSRITRWKDALISWKSSAVDIWSYLKEYLLVHAALLETLVMEVKYDGVVNGRDLVPWRIWRNASRLRKLMTVVVSNDGQGIRPQVRDFSRRTHFYKPHQQLTHLRLEANPNEFLGHNQVISMLKCTPNLISCFLEGIYDSIISFIPNNRITLQYLRHLYLESHDTDRFIRIRRIHGLLDYITASSLVTLTVADSPNFQFESCEDFILRSSCALEELNFYKTDLSIGDAFTTLELSPSLRSVNFDTFLIDDSFSERWAAWNAGEEKFQLCPNLERLSISGIAHWALPWPPESRGPSTAATQSKITRALAARIHPPTGISKKLTFLISSSNDKYVPQVLRALCDEPSGLTIGFNDGIFERGRLWDLYTD